MRTILRESAEYYKLPNVNSFVESGIKAYNKAVKESRKSKYPSEKEFRKFLERTEQL